MAFGKHLITLGLAAALGVSPALAAQDDADGSSGETVPQISPIALDFDADGISGPAADVLREEIARSQFVMIGEDHGYADPPLLLSALGAEGSEHGFDYYAVEVGPISTAWLEDKLAAGGTEELAAVFAGRPLAAPFLSMREEALAALPYACAGKLWGVDQEFIGSPLIHFEFLAERATGDVRAMVEGLLNEEREAFASGNQANVFIVKAQPEDWQNLRDAFSDDELALAVIHELERSAKVYQSNFQGRGLDNNLDRVALIREYFLDAYTKAQAVDGKPPKVVMKFGATHGGRSTSPMATFDLGSIIEGMAAANGMEALHIVYMPLGGEQTAIRPSPDGWFLTKPTDGEKLRSLLGSAGVDLAAMEGSEGHFLIPMNPVKRALRNKGLQELDGMSRFFVLGFDYLVTTNAAKPATPLASE